MKSLLFLICAVTILSTEAFAVALQSDQRPDQNIMISEELSTILLDSRYQQALTQLKKQAKSAKSELVITQFSTLNIPTSPEQYAYVLVSLKKGGNLTDIGSIVGQYFVDSKNKVVYQAVFFKPAESGPGGGSVGN